MTTEQKVARRKPSLPEPASDLGNVSRARKAIGYSRRQFCDIRRAFQTCGADGLVDRLPGPRNPHPNRLPGAVEQAILGHAPAHPCHGPIRVAQELVPRGSGAGRHPGLRGRRARGLAAARAADPKTAA